MKGDYERAKFTYALTHLTENERKIIQAYKNDPYVGDHGWESDEAGCWCDDIDAGSHGLTGKTISGTLSSLKKKGLIGTNSEYFWLTKLGKDVAREVR
jgi:hypothetical protein